MAADAQTKPTGDGAIILDAVLAQLSNMTSVSSLPFAAYEPLRADLLARAEMGLKKYGTKLRAQNGRSAMLDLYQEILDAVMYAQQGRVEGDRTAGKYVEILLSFAAQIVLELDKR